MQATYQIRKPGVMGGFYEAGPWHDTARMTRVPLPQLLSPSAEVSWSRRIEDRLATDLVENGKPVGLEVILFKPEGPGPFPLAVLNHGSTGDGKDPRIFSLSWAADGIAAFLVDRGWLVAFPQRRGRGKSDGLYDEGFEVDRTQGYTSGITRTTQGFERALTDIAAAIKALQKRPDVAAGPILIGGQSRGGILSVAYAGRHPETVAAVLNFVGGWLGGEDQDAGPINRGLFKRGAVYPGQTLWLYGLDDAVYSIAHCRRNFTAFEATGGKGQFIEFDVPGKDRGHGVIDFDELWRGAVERYLDTLPVKP